MEAEAKGLYEILTKQAEGYREVVSAADPTKAFQLLIEKLPELVRTQVEAVKTSKLIKLLFGILETTEITELVQLLTLLLE
jgi:flotillin